MRIEELDISRAVALALQEPYAYITRLSSRAQVGPTPAAFSTKEVVEAHFFGPLREIRFYRQDDALCAVMLEEEETDTFLEKTSELRDPGFGHALTLRQYITYDEDGQGSIRSIRLVEWKEHADERTE